MSASVKSPSRPFTVYPAMKTVFYLSNVCQVFRGLECFPGGLQEHPASGRGRRQEAEDLLRGRHCFAQQEYQRLRSLPSGSTHVTA